MKEIKDDTNGKVSCAFGLEEFILVKCPYYPKTNNILNVITIKILMTFFTELEQMIYMEPQKTPNYQSYLKKKKSWKYHIPWIQKIVQSYSNWIIIRLALKQSHRSMEQNREPRNKHMQPWSINLWQRRQEYTTGQSLQ